MRSTRSINSRAPSSAKRSWKLSTRRLASSVAGHGLGAEENVGDEEQENKEPRAGKNRRGARARAHTSAARERGARPGVRVYDEDEAGDVTAMPPPSVQSTPTYTTAARRPPTSSLPRNRSPLGNAVVARAAQYARKCL
ncbi:hypothetical protein FA95DRAFT_1605249 [Auriscalpium vulgare]|uniref:Uncharacterized protein n=1 Tax=Auriscalpium vulgare TaxID=40419 RepID=A0ACB8RXN7_9AGAM|nr:hypothetical protein FA95DRAFT_1605249 [Auriscalpium vulgare]